MDNFYVYQYVRSRTSKYGEIGSPYYIGKGKGKRAWSGIGRTTKRPSSKDQIFVLSWYEDEAEAFREEERLISLYGRIDLGTGCLRNRIAGGEGNSGRVIREETRKKMSAAKKGRKLPPETCKRMSESFKSRRLTPEHRKRLSEFHKGNKHCQGRICSEETRRKVSDSLKGHKVSERTMQALLKANVGRKLSEDHRRKISEGNKKRWANVRKNCSLVSQ
jgi:hypothetical protein